MKYFRNDLNYITKDDIIDMCSINNDIIRSSFGKLLLEHY